MEPTEFYSNRFANDELLLENMQTFYVSVEIMDALNRTFRGRSNGVTIYIQPPAPGAVRDGPHMGEDRNYQQSVSEYAVNWDDFGSDEPGERIPGSEAIIRDSQPHLLPGGPIAGRRGSLLVPLSRSLDPVLHAILGAPPPTKGRAR